MECRIRPATMDDCAMLWRWRNDPVTCRMQRDIRPVPWDRYRDWYARALQNPERAILIAAPDDPDAGDDVGVAQFLLERPGGMAAMGLNLNPRYRGRGLAARLIELFCEEARRRLSCSIVIAEVKAENMPSRRAFACAGFVLDGRQKGILTFSRTLTAGRSRIERGG